MDTDDDRDLNELLEMEYFCFRFDNGRPVVPGEKDLVLFLGILMSAGVVYVSCSIEGGVEDKDKKEDFDLNFC